MTSHAIYSNDWLRIHPYTSAQPTDTFYVRLANGIFRICLPYKLPEPLCKDIALYTAAYMEDQVSGLGLWHSFTYLCWELYGKYLPFYPTTSGYTPQKINEADLSFLIWNTWQKSPFPPDYLHPHAPQITKLAADIHSFLKQTGEEAPANESLPFYFDEVKDKADAGHKLEWLFGHTYLTEPAMRPYIAHIAPSDRFIIPTGPLALFLHEWVSTLSESHQTWRKIEGLFPEEKPVPPHMAEMNRMNYQNFTGFMDGKNIAYLNGYESLKDFLVHVLKWPDDANHTLPQMKRHRNFILMAHPQKGILLAKDICEYIADPDNPMYDRTKACGNAFRLLTEEGLCPPDLLIHCIQNHLLPDASLPGEKGTMLVQENADFIARHSLLYYYRGD